MQLNGVFAMSRDRWVMLRSSGLTSGTCHYFSLRGGWGGGGGRVGGFWSSNEKVYLFPFQGSVIFYLSFLS